MNRIYFKYLSVASAVLVIISIIFETNILTIISLLITFVLSAVLQFKREKKAENNEISLTRFPKRIVLRNRSSNFNRFFGNGMNKPQRSGMKRNTSVRIGTRRTIFQITFHRNADFGKLRPNLMMPSCFKINFQ